MTREEIIEMLIIERNCVERQDTPLCDRHCESCDLCMPTDKVVKAYEQAIDILHQEPCETSTDEPMTMVYPTIFCEDCISRQDAIEFFKDDIYVVNELKNLASVQPSHKDSLIKHLKDRPCSVCEFNKENGCCKWTCVFCDELFGDMRGAE